MQKQIPVKTNLLKIVVSLGEIGLLKEKALPHNCTSAKDYHNCVAIQLKRFRLSIRTWHNLLAPSRV